MNIILTIIQVIISILLITVILLQPKGGGLGSTFGGSYVRTRRGAEKFLFQLTIVLSVLFVGLSIANIFA